MIVSEGPTHHTTVLCDKPRQHCIAGLYVINQNLVIKGWLLK